MPVFNVWLEQGGDARDLQVNKRRIERGQEEADSLLVLPALPQTLAHWLRPAPPSTLPTERNIVQHMTGPDRNLKYEGTICSRAWLHCSKYRLASNDALWYSRDATCSQSI